MAALVFVGSMISIPLPYEARIHMGNIFCLLAGFMLGGLKGGLAAGIGSMFYDFTNPLYISDAPITFINKFMMAFVCGVIAGGVIKSYAASDKPAKTGKKVVRLLIAAVAGALTYVALYLTKSYFTMVLVERIEWEVIAIKLSTKAASSIINGTIAAVVSVPLAVALKSGLRRAGLGRWLGAEN